MDNISLDTINNLLKPLGIEAYDDAENMMPKDNLRWILRKTSNKRRIVIFANNGYNYASWSDLQNLVQRICSASSMKFAYLDAINNGVLDIYQRCSNLEDINDGVSNIYRGCSNLEEMQIKKDLLANG